MSNPLTHNFLHEAVRAAYPNAVTVYGNNIDSLEAFDINHNPVVVVATDVIAQQTVLQENYTEAQETQAATKAAALAKLTALGLTADEVKAIIG
jgi:hypothetical protein